MTRQPSTPNALRFLITLFCVAGLATAAFAQNEEPATWVPPQPSDTEQDWVQFTSGEWLSGDLQQLSDGDVKFDSEELEGLTLDFADIAEIRSSRRHTYRFEGREVVTGTAMMKDGQITIDTGTEVITRDRALLVSMIEGEPKELNYWSGEGTLGFSLKSGNTNTSDLTVYAMLKRETALTRWRTQYDGYISSRDGDDTDNNHRVRSTFDFFFTRRFYVALPTFEYYTDQFINIDTRLTTGASLGYELFKRDKILVDISGGLAHQYTTTTVPGDTGDNDAAVTTGISIETDPMDNLEWDTSYRIALVVTDFDKTNHNLRSVLSFDIWGPLDLDTTFQYDRIEKPALNADGTRPLSDDFRVSIGVGVDF